MPVVSPSPIARPVRGVRRAPQGVQALPAPRDQHREAARQGVYAVLDQGIVSLTSFAATVAVGRLLGEAPLGVFSLALVTFWLLAGVPNALVWTPFAARAPRLRPAGRASYAGSVDRQALALGALGGLLSLAASGVAAWSLGTESWVPLFLASLGVLVFAMTVREHVRRQLIADYRGPELLTFDVLVCLAQGLTFWGVWAAGQLNAYTAILALSLGASIGFCWVPWSASRPAARLRRAHLAANWGLGRWLLVVSLAWLCSDAALRWLLVGIHGADALGDFAAAFTIVMLGNPVIVAMTSLARTYAARLLASAGLGSLLKVAGGWTLVGCVSTLPALLFLAQFGGWLVGLAFGDQFQGEAQSVWVIVPVALAVCLQAVTIPAEATLTALRQGRWMSAIATARLVAALALGAPLIYVWGAEGVAITLASQNLLALALSWGAILWERGRAAGDGTLSGPLELDPSIG